MSAVDRASLPGVAAPAYSPPGFRGWGLPAMEPASTCGIECLPFSAEEKLAQLEAVLAAAPVGLATLDLDFRYILVNEAFSRMYGKPVEDFPGRTIEQALPRWAAQIRPHLEHCLNSGTTVECEITVDLPGADGSMQQRVYLRTCKPVRDRFCRIVILSSVLVDITERKQAQAALMESEEHYRSAVELSPHIPWTCGPDGKRFEISQRWTELTNLKSGKITIEDWADAPHPDDVPIVVAAWTHSLATGAPLDIEYRVRCGDGQMRWIRGRAAARRGASGDILRWYGTNEDIDERKRIDAALREKTARLQQSTDQMGLRILEDHLTGLANRRNFDETLSREVKVAMRSGRPLSLIMIDVDHFKAFNDSYGHVAGDDCLRKVAGALATVAGRSSDLVARYGGEEFTIVLPNTDEAAALGIAERALSRVRALNIPHRAAASERVTISAGAAALVFCPDFYPDKEADAAESAGNLVRMADLALYAAKKAGRDRARTTNCLPPLSYTPAAATGA